MTFFVTGFPNKRTCQLFLQAFQMKHSRFSGIMIANKILLLMQEGTMRFFNVFLYIMWFCIFLYIHEKCSLCSFPQWQRLVCSWCSIRTSIFRPLGQTHISLNMAGYFLAREKSPNNIKMTEWYREFKILPFPTELPTKWKNMFSMYYR